MEKQRLQELEDTCIQECAPPCAAACPVHVDCRGVALLMAQGDFPGALKLLRRALPFPAIIGAICDQPCRNYCNRGRAGGPVEMAALELAAARFGETAVPRITLLPARGKNVAVVGGGLSGLTAVFDLCKKGYGVTVFESGDRLGGSLWEYAGARLSREIAEKDFSILATMGIELRLQTTADPFDLPEFDAVYAAPGTAAAAAFTAIDPLTYATNRVGVFAGGSLLRSPEAYSPIFSVSDGRRAAVSIDRFLQGASLSASRTGEGSLQSCLYTNMDDVALRQAPEVPAEGFSLPEAEQEAGRCLQCQCLECVKACTYLESFGGYPKKYVREIYNNLSIVMGMRQSNTLTNSCSLCGLCAEVCPNDLNMADVCRDARRTMVSQKRMPPSAHDFALRDMAFANSGACALAQCAAGSTTCSHLFFPGCQLAASAPAHVEKAYRLLQEKLGGGVGVMLRCCGAPADWAGRDDLLKEALAEFKVLHRELGSPRVIFACPSCARVFRRLMPDLDTISLWEVFDGAGMAFVPHQSTGPVVSLHDPCSARHDSAVQESTRRIATRLGCTITELPLSRSTTTCCSFGGLQWFANNRLARTAIERRMRESTHDYLTYCSMCRDLFAAQGKRCLHMLDLMFEDDLQERAGRDCPTWSQRHDNRALLKRTLCAEQKEETMADIARGPALVISAEVQSVLDDRFILTHDIARVIEHADTTGRKLLQPGTGRILAYCKIGSVTYWVEYVGAQGGPYTIYNAYSHRMEIRERTDA